MEKPSTSPLRYLVFAGLLIFTTVLAYWPALHGGFVWDDNAWTADISHLLKDVSGLRSMWVHPEALQQYYPLTGTSFWLDYHLWKDWTFPYHLENLVLHLAAVFLFWRLLHQLKIPGAWLAAGIFALHPMMVESVAWITERKNVLSLVFFLGSLLAYGKFNSFWQENQRPPKRHMVWYGVAFLLFIGALLVKTTTFSLPAVVLLVGWWKNGKISWRKDIVPGLPFFLVAITGSILTASLEKNHVGAQGWEWTLSLPERCLIAGRAFWFYPGKMLWPGNLCFIYPRWNPDVGSWWQCLLPIIAVGFLVGLWIMRKKIGRGPVAAAFYFIGTIFPVLGFMNAYGMRYSFVWDHWVYLSSLGLIAIAASLITTLIKDKIILPVVAIILLSLFTFLTWNQSSMYVNNETLLRATIAKNPTAFMAYNNLGYILLQRNQPAEAIPLFQKALEIDPKFVEPHNNLGEALVRVGRIEEGMEHYREAITAATSDSFLTAVAYYNYGNAFLQIDDPKDSIEPFQKALEINPGFAKARNNLGCAFLRTGQTNDAILSFRKAIEIDPGFADAYKNLGDVLLAQDHFEEAATNFQRAITCYAQSLPRADEAGLRGKLANLLVRQNRPAEAIAEYEHALKLDPDNGELQFNLGVTLILNNQLDNAAQHLKKAVELIPNSAPPHYRLGLVWQMQKQYGNAVVEYQKALNLNPDYLSARNNLAWILATCPDTKVRDGKRAMELTLAAENSTAVNSPGFLDTQAAAYAEVGEFPKAVAAINRAISLATNQGDTSLAEALRSRQKLYTANTAFHESP